MRRELTLAIETSNPSAVEPDRGRPAQDPGPPAGADVPGVAIGERLAHGEARVLGVESITLDRRHDDDLLPAIDRLMKRLALGPRDLTRIAVSVGPGGFTGLRVGIASAKMIAEAVGARCVAVPSSHVVARRVVSEEQRPPGVFAVALASKGSDAFVTLFDAAGVEVGPGRVMERGDVAGLADLSLFIADRFLPGPIADVLAARGIRIVAPRFDAACCFEASLGLAEIDPVDLLPIYPREAEAVRKWRELHPR